MDQDIRIGAPTVPTAGATVTLFDSTKVFGTMGLRMNYIHRATVSFYGLDRDVTLSGKNSPDHGSNWYTDTFAAVGDPNALPLTVTANATGVSSFDVDITAHDDVQLLATAGTPAPSVWKVVIVLVIERHSAS